MYGHPPEPQWLHVWAILAPHIKKRWRGEPYVNVSDVAKAIREIHAEKE